MKKTKMLKKNYEFKNVLNKGNYYSGRYIEAFIFKNNFKFNLLGLAISVKTAKAVKRNLIKRLIRENYKNIEESIKTGYSIVFLWKKKSNIEDATYKNIKEDMYKIISKSKLNKENI